MDMCSRCGQAVVFSYMIRPRTCVSSVTWLRPRVSKLIVVSVNLRRLPGSLCGVLAYSSFPFWTTSP
jgi:hypothetical protein